MGTKPARAVAMDDRLYDQRLREMNDALLVSSVRQEELTEKAQQSEQAALKSEERFRTLTQAITSVVWTTNAEGRFVTPQPSWSTYTGQTWEEMRDFGWVNALHPDDRDRVQTLWQAAKASLTLYKSDGRVWCAATNGYRRFEASGLPILNSDGAVEEWIGMYRDVEVREHAVDAMQESEARFRELVEQVTDYAIFRTDPEGRATTWNAGVERVLGFTEQEFLGQYIAANIFTPEDVASGVPQRELDEAAATGTAGNDRWMRRKDGSRFFAAGMTTALRDDRGRLIGFTKVMRDQTERERIEAALAESEERHRRLFEAALDGILVLNAKKGKITNANPFIADLLGYSPDELIGKELWQTGLLKDKAENEAMFRELQDKGMVRYDHLPLETKHGKQIQVEFISNTYTVDDQPVAQCHIRDTTDRVRLDEMTKEQARSMADLNRRKDEFLAMLSHELRNPLAPILNAVQLLHLQKDRSEIQREAHGMIERQVSHLRRLVDDLLEVSRISTGRIHLQEERIDLRGVVGRAIESASPQCGQKGQSIGKSMPDGPVWVYGDPVRLEQVVVNLLNNACKYTDSKGHIWIGLTKKGDEAELRVRDNGMGIPPELLPNIFDLFTQAEKSLDRSQGGLGIGLSLVQSLVTMHRGRVDALSTVGQGSEFIVRLPLLLSPQDSGPRPAENAERSTHSLRVLVVDDNVDAAKSIAMLLRASGHEIRLAHDGAAAMQAALEFQPQVVLLDIGLPVISGFQVAQSIRKEPALKDVVLVALTGYGQESDRERTRAAGFNHHLVKPADFKKLQSILSAVAEKPS